MILPNTDISIMDVRNATGYPSTDLGTLCSCNKIKPFSIWKPINYNGSTLTLDIIKQKNYGLTITESNAPDSLVAKIKSEGTFQYNKPRGGSASPYRLGDFRNYNNNAKLPSYPIGERTIDNGGAAVTGLASINNGDGSSTEVGFNQLYKFIGSDGNPVKLNRGVYMVNPNGDTAWATDNIEWSKIRNSTNWIKKTDVTVYDFWTNVKKTIDGIYTGSADDIFVANVSDEDNPNPYVWHLTGSKPAGSEEYYFKLKVNFAQGSNDVIEYRVTMSSIGEVYYGGTANNISLQFRDKPDYTQGQQLGGVQIGNYTIGREEEKVWEGDSFIFVPIGVTTVWAFLFANGALKETTAVLMPSN